MIISHNRYFLDSIVDKIFLLEDMKLKIFNGNYTYYREKSIENQQVNEKKNIIVQEKTKEKRYASKSKLRNIIDKCEEEIIEKEKVLKDLREESCNIAPSNYKSFELIGKSIGQLENDLENLYLRWEELNKKLEDLL